jgi:hypothetical protein
MGLLAMATPSRVARSTVAFHPGLALALPMPSTPDEATAKILAQHEVFRHDRYLMQMSVGDQRQAAILRSIELLGTVIAPEVRGEVGKRKVSA